MGNQVLPSGKLAKILESQLGKIDQKFWKELGRFNLVGIILDLISKGISPVAGVAGRFQKYSASYINQIKGKKQKTGTYTPISFKQSFGGVGVVGGKKKRKSAVVQSAKFQGKKVSPVNLKVTGDMHRSLSYNPNNGILLADSELWVFHNEGMGNLPVRRLLPNKSGERFNRRIEQKITEALGAVLGIKGNKSKRFIKVRYNIR